MNHYKKVLICSIVFFSAQGLFAQYFPYKTQSEIAETNAVTGNYKLVWQDEFNGTQLDTINNWVVEVNGDGGGNNELEYYCRKNISIGQEPISGAGFLFISVYIVLFLVC